MQHQAESGARHQRDEEDQDKELDAVSKNINVLLGESDSRGQQAETDVLLRALVEAEIDGLAVTNQLTALKETIDNLAKEKRLSKLHATSLARQKGLLFEKIEMFENTNHNLRELLREWSGYARESLMRSEHNDVLKKRLADCEADNLRLSAKLINKEKEAFKLAEHLDFEKDNVKTTAELSRILESTRDHLETQLNRTEAERAQLSAQIQRMQQSNKQQQKELWALQEELQTLRQRRDENQDEQERQHRAALTLITQQAERAEESARHLAEKLQEKVRRNVWSHALKMTQICKASLQV